MVTKLSLDKIMSTGLKISILSTLSGDSASLVSNTHDGMTYIKCQMSVGKATSLCRSLVKALWSLGYW